MQGASVREEIEIGARDVKETNRAYWASSREENESWEERKEAMMQAKEANEGKEGWDAEAWTKTYRRRLKEHKAVLAELDNAHIFKSQAYLPRFKALGSDSEGRLYYASSGFEHKGKGRAKKATMPSLEERENLQKWGWFLAVWGKGGDPNDASKRGENDVDAASDNDEGEREERWWGFADPVEVKKLAKWLATHDEGAAAHSSHTSSEQSQRLTQDIHVEQVNRPGSPLSVLSDDDEDDDADVDADADLGRNTRALALTGGPADIKGLVKELNSYAALLAWRCGVPIGGTNGDEEGEKEGMKDKRG